MLLLLQPKRILYTGLFVVRTQSNLPAFWNTQGFQGVYRAMNSDLSCRKKTKQNKTRRAIGFWTYMLPPTIKPGVKTTILWMHDSILVKSNPFTVICKLSPWPYISFLIMKLQDRRSGHGYQCRTISRRNHRVSGTRMKSICYQILYDVGYLSSRWQKGLPLTTS